MSVSEELLERSIWAVWNNGATEEELMKLFHLRRKRVQELLQEGRKRGLI